MKIRDVIKISTGALRKNRLRTLLTVLGVVIGISSVTVIISAGESMEKLVYDQMASFGSDMIQAEVRAPSSSGGSVGQVQGVVITTMTEKDRHDILALPYIDKAYSAVTAQEVIAWEGNAKRALIFAVTEDFIDIDSSEIEEGRFFTDEEDRNLARVVVLGQSVKEDLFGASQAIGQSVKIKGQNYRVIGVMKKRGAVFFFDMDDLVYMPLQTTQRFLLGINHVLGVYAQINDPDKTEETAQAMKEILRENHGISNPDRDDFEVMSMGEAQDMLSTVIGGVTLLLLALAGVSLIVGGVGIMNIMYASVAERTFEIGLRKSIGASKKVILQQFLFEAIIITILGAVLGLLLGFIMIYGVYFIAQNYGFDWSLSFSLSGMLIALSFSIAIGLIFGIYPAKRAADLDSISALRKE